MAKATTKDQNELLSAIASEISDWPRTPGDHEIARLKEFFGLKLIERPRKSGRFVAKMQGIETKPADSIGAALRNWANKARRQVLQAQA